MKEVKFENVSKFYGNRKVLDGFNLSIGAGERVVIFGPSGCGKTTILRIVAGLTAPDRGRVIIGSDTVSADGKVIIDPSRRGIGMVFQDLALWPHMTVKGNIEFGLKAKKVPKEERQKRIKKILEVMGMTEFSETKPHTLSGGQQQRVALARALVLNPDILLMDEPMSSIDIEMKAVLLKHILEIHSRMKFTLIYVTHDRDEAMKIGERIIVIKNGRIFKTGTPEEIAEYFERVIGV